MDGNLPIYKHADLTSNASAPYLIRVNVIHRASNCYLVQTSNIHYFGTVTICYPTTEKNHPVDVQDCTGIA